MNYRLNVGWNYPFAKTQEEWDMIDRAAIIEDDLEPGQLKPCPFCGGEAEPDGWSSIDRVGPACAKCGGSADTVELWNSRPLAAVRPAPPSKETIMNDAQITHMLDRFLAWRLPKDFRPDNGISYKRPNYSPNVDATPTGTNLFDAEQARAMIRHMVEEMSAPPSIPEREKVLEALKEAYHAMNSAPLESPSHSFETKWDKALNLVDAAIAALERK